MTLEELQAEVARLSTELETVTSNNTKLVKEKRDALTRAEKAEQAAEEAAENAKAETGSELDKATRRIAKLEKDLEAERARADGSDANYRNYRATAAINEAIASNNVDSKHTAMLAKAFEAWK